MCWIARRVGRVPNPQYDGAMESLAINASYISIANLNITRGRPSGAIA